MTSSFTGHGLPSPHARAHLMAARQGHRQALLRVPAVPGRRPSIHAGALLGRTRQAPTHPRGRTSDFNPRGRLFAQSAERPVTDLLLSGRLSGPCPRASAHVRLPRRAAAWLQEQTTRRASRSRPGSTLGLSAGRGGSSSRGSSGGDPATSGAVAAAAESCSGCVRAAGVLARTVMRRGRGRATIAGVRFVSAYRRRGRGRAPIAGVQARPACHGEPRLA